jgi:orotidine-5'-phosphate decarboxylase
MSEANPICVALDTPDLDRARALAKKLKPHVGYLKIGMEFFYAHGAKGYEAVAAEGLPIFLDLKLHDIPNTVAEGMRSLLRLQPSPAIINLHASGGMAMMQAAAEAVGGRSKLIAITLLTSLSNEDIWAMGFNAKLDTGAHAAGLAKLAKLAGLDGVVCSSHDLADIRAATSLEFLTVVPGIRPAEDASHDQKRVATPKSAMVAGADILVIGRAITGAPDPAVAAKKILEGLRRG